MAQKGNSKSYARKIITELPLCSTVTVKKWSHIFTILSFVFFCMEGCSWNIQLFLVIVRDSLLARISPAAHSHHSSKTDSASLVHSGWTCVFFSVILSWVSKMMCRAAPSGEPRAAGGSPVLPWVRVPWWHPAAGWGCSRSLGLSPALQVQLGFEELLGQCPAQRFSLRFAAQQLNFCCYLRCSIFPRIPQATGTKKHHLKSNLANKYSFPRVQIRGKVVVNS